MTIQNHIIVSVEKIFAQVHRRGVKGASLTSL